MTVALAFSGTQKTRNGITVNLTGDAATTNRVITVTHPGGYTENHTVTTSGGGAASVVIVPGEAGTITATVISAPSAPSTIVGPITATVAT